jgi:hypothetical protein
MLYELSNWQLENSIFSKGAEFGRMWPNTSNGLIKYANRCTPKNGVLNNQKIF